MKANFFVENISKVQNQLYNKLNIHSKNNPHSGRLLSIPVAVIDAALYTFKIPLHAIESAVLVPLNLIGAMFSNDYSVKDSIMSFEWALSCAAVTPIKLGIAPIVLVYQVVMGIYDAKNVKSFDAS